MKSAEKIKALRKLALWYVSATISMNPFTQSVQNLPFILIDILFKKNNTDENEFI